MIGDEFKNFLLMVLNAQPEVAAASWPAGALHVVMADPRGTHISVDTAGGILITKVPSDPEPEPELRALLLWEIVNGWYWEVSNAARRCAEMMVVEGRPLNDEELFVIAAEMWTAERDGSIGKVTYGTWPDTVKVAHDSLLILNGDVPDELPVQFQEWVEEDFGAVGNYAETAGLFLFATGPMPSTRYVDKKERV